MNNPDEYNGNSRTCSHCGAPLAAAARFCNNCGKPTVPRAGVAQAAYSGKSSGGRKGWLVCGVLAGLSALVVACVAVIGGLFWTETIPLPDFLRGSGETAVLEVPTPQPPVVAVQTEPAEPAAPIDPVSMQTETVIEEVPTERPADISFSGVSMSADSNLGVKLTAENIPAVTDPNLPPWELIPSHIKISLEDYSIQGTFHEPHILIFPLTEYYTYGQSPKVAVNRLLHLLETQDPTPKEAIPFLPEWNAAQAFHAAVQYVNFKNGAGVRFLTQYGQDVGPVNNDAIFYCYQGITSDGLYYVSAVLPVFEPSLPKDSSEIPIGDYQAFSDGYPAYIEGVGKELTDLPDSAFEPDLKMLDDMMSSLEIKP